MKCDKQLTAQAGFADRRSYVRPDGREVLKGFDMEKRRLEIWARSKGECEGMIQTHNLGTMMLCHKIIYWESFHLHHIKHRGSNGVDRDDRAANLLGLCGECHKSCHVQVRWTKNEAKSS